SMIQHHNSSVFESLPNPMQVCRYHSLVVDRGTLPNELHVTAETEDGVVMAIAHTELPIVGLQFHPESILTDAGYPLLTAFSKLAGLRVGERQLSIDNELKVPPPDEFVEPDHPVTF
ncbi:MAG: anthranilate synthase component 2, partial [Pirellulaceae bacterium]